VAPREVGLRFVTGAITSVLAGLVGLVDERAGGLFLAFPSILIASLTLVEQKEGRDEAREDARGALRASLGMIAFAGAAAALLVSAGAAVALGTALLAWGGRGGAGVAAVAALAWRLWRP